MNLKLAILWLVQKLKFRVILLNKHIHNQLEALCPLWPLSHSNGLERKNIDIADIVADVLLGKPRHHKIEIYEKNW